MRYSMIILAYAIWCFFVAPFSEAGLREKVQERELSNGLQVILLENHRAPVATFQVWYRVGSRNEPWGKSGLSHVLEHMMFKGTESISGEEFTRRIQEIGGESNAFTSSDYTAYFENLRADKIEIAMKLEADRMQNLVIQEEPFQTERMVVMEERRLRTEDNPRANLFEQFNSVAYQLHPYRRPVIGWMQDLRRLSSEGVRAYYKTYYHPGNALLVAVGDFDAGMMMSKIERIFGRIPRGPSPEELERVEPPQHGERRVRLKREANKPYLILGYHVPNINEADAYILKVMSELLAGGKSSRLYRILVREKELAGDVSTDYSLLSLDPGLFLMSAEPLEEGDTEQLEHALDQELQRLRTEAVEDAELERAKNQIEADFVFGQDSIFFQAMLLARYEITATWEAIEDYIPSIRKVTHADILKVAKRYLVPENRTVGILVPSPQIEAPTRSHPFSIKRRIVE